MNGMKVSKGEIEAAALDYAKGDKALAAAFKAGFKACQSLTRVHSVKMPERFDRRKKVGEREIKEMLRLRKDGWTYQALAAKFGVSMYCAQYHLHHEEMKAYAKIRQKERWDNMTEAQRKAHNRQTLASVDYKKGLRIRGVL